MNILITGASGLIGKRLTELLLQKGHTVSHLSRSNSQETPGVKVFKWDVYNRIIDPSCLKEADTLIHLAGEGIADKRWSKKRKVQIIESRTASIRLLYGLMNSQTTRIKTVISASAVGYYGDRGDEILTEESKPGTGFLSDSCIEWENAVDEVPAGIRLVKLRTGIVLAKEGGALVPIAKTVKLGIGSELGSGRQWMPWIHLEDSVRMYEFVLENTAIKDTYNMVAPYPETNNAFTSQLARQLNKPFWFPAVPEFVLKLLLGEMSAVVLSSQNVSSEKIQGEGFKFLYPTVKEAFADLYGKQ